jgi:hypothetical protein
MPLRVRIRRFNASGQEIDDRIFLLNFTPRGGLINSGG